MDNRMEHVPESREDVKVQLIISTGEDIKLLHVCVTTLPPYALGIPSPQVQLYCADTFRAFDPDNEVRAKSDVRKLLGPLNFMGLKAANVVPDIDGDSEFFDYFWDILLRSVPLRESAPIEKCSLRIIAGHGYSLGGDTLLNCGNTVSFGRIEEVETNGPRNASVLTVLDICNAPMAVQGLKNRNFQCVPSEEVFNNVDFPLACIESSRTSCFRVSWEGHHELADKKHPKFAERYPNMSEPIGFPVVSSLIAAVRARYIEGEEKDLGSLLVEKLQSIQRRYMTPGRPFSEMKESYHDLTFLQHLLDNNILSPKVAAFECLLYSRHKEWFLTTELVTALPQKGEGLAQTVAKFVHTQVIDWHKKNPGELWETNADSEMAWQRLSSAMGPFRGVLYEVSFSLKSDGEIVSCDDEDCDWWFRQWAISCRSLPETVDRVIHYLESGNGKYLTGK